MKLFNAKKDTITFSRCLATRLLGLAQQSPDLEICGLIAADDHGPTSLYPIKNIAKEPATSFLMEAESHIEARKAIRENNEQIFAVYHSHPSSPPMMSAADLEDLGYPELYQIIISLNTKGVLEMRAYKVVKKGVEEIPILLEHFEDN